MRRMDDFDYLAEMAVEDASVQSALQHTNDGDLIIALAAFMRSHAEDLHDASRPRKRKAKKKPGGSK